MFVADAFFAIDSSSAPVDLRRRLPWEQKQTGKKSDQFRRAV